MRWPWSKPKPLPIPKFRPDPPQIEPKPEPIEVNELHESMSRTGIHRVWQKWKGE